MMLCHYGIETILILGHHVHNDFMVSMEFWFYDIEGILILWYQYLFEKI